MQPWSQELFIKDFLQGQKVICADSTTELYTELGKPGKCSFSFTLAGLDLRKERIEGGLPVFPSGWPQVVLREGNLGPCPLPLTCFLPDSYADGSCVQF